MWAPRDRDAISIASCSRLHIWQLQCGLSRLSFIDRCDGLCVVIATVWRQSERDGRGAHPHVQPTAELRVIAVAMSTRQEPPSPPPMVVPDALEEGESTPEREWEPPKRRLSIGLAKQLRGSASFGRSFGGQPQPESSVETGSSAFAWEDRMREYICSGLLTDARALPPRPVMVTGVVGAGKTWVSTKLAEWARGGGLREALLLGAEDTGVPVCVIHHVVGRTHGSRKHTTLLRRILRRLKETFDIRQSLPHADQDENLADVLASWSELAAARGPTLLVVDGVSELQDHGDALRLGWLPVPHRKGRYPFQIVVTAAAESLAFNTAQTSRWPIWMITPPSRQEVEQVVDCILTQWGELPDYEQQWSPVKTAIVDAVVPARPPPNPRGADQRPQRMLDATSRVWVGQLSPRFLNVLLGELCCEVGEARLALCKRVVTTTASLAAQKPPKPSSLTTLPYSLFATETRPAVIEALGSRAGLGSTKISDAQVAVELKLRWDILTPEEQQPFEQKASVNAEQNKAQLLAWEASLADWNAKFVKAADTGAAVPGGHVVGLYEQKIRRLAESSGHPQLLKRVLAWLCVTRVDIGEAGLARGELEGLLLTTFDLVSTEPQDARCIADVMRSAAPLLAQRDAANSASVSGDSSSDTGVSTAASQSDAKTTLCTLLDSQLREAVAKVFGEDGVKEAELHYQLATYFLDVVGSAGYAGPSFEGASNGNCYHPSYSRYIDLAWHLRQANVKAELRNVITEPMALHQFMQKGSVLEYLQFCRFCYDSWTDVASRTPSYSIGAYSSTVRQLITEIESAEFPVDVVESCARFAHESGCGPEALQLYRKCLLASAQSPDLLTETSDGSEAADLKRAEYMWEIAQLHARNGVDVMKGGGSDIERKEMRYGEADNLLLGALALLGVESAACPPPRQSVNIYKPPRTPTKDDQKWRRKRSTTPRNSLATSMTHIPRPTKTNDGRSSPIGQSYESSKLIGNVQHLLGLLRMLQKKYDEAVWFTKEALRRRKDVQPVAAADTFNLLGSIYHKQAMAEDHDPSVQRNLLDRAQECLKEGLAIRRRLLMQNDPDIGQSLNTIAGLLKDRNEAEQAVEHFQKAYDVYSAGLGELHYRTSHPLGPLAEMAYADGRVKDACDFLSRKVDIIKAVGPVYKKELSETLDKLQEWQAELGEPTPAARTTSFELAVEEALGEESELEAGAMAMTAAKIKFWNELGKLLEKRGSIDKIAQTERDQLLDTMLQSISPAAQLTQPISLDSSIFTINDNISYDLQEVLGTGSLGTKVFRGTYRETTNGRIREAQAAVKRVDRTFTKIAREAGALQAIDHPNVVKLYGLVDDPKLDQEYAYLALELCSTTLEKAVKDDNLEADPLELCRQMANGLMHMHKMGFVHLDLHFANVLLADGAAAANSLPWKAQTAKLSDFGLSRNVGADESISTMTHAGAAGWAAPEARIAGGAPASSMSLPKAADIFSLGCLFYFTLTRGDHPFGDHYQREANIAKYTADEDEPLPEQFSDTIVVDTRDLSSPMVTPAQRHLIEWMTHRDPYCRPEIGQVTRHPAFWSAEDQFDYLCSIARRLGDSVQVRNGRSSKFAEVLLESCGEQFGPGGWMALLRVDTSAVVTKTPSGGFEIEKLALANLSRDREKYHLAFDREVPARGRPSSARRPSSAGPSLARTSSAGNLGRQSSTDDGVFGLLHWIASHSIPLDTSARASQVVADWWESLIRPFPWLLITVATLDAEHSSAKTLVDIGEAAPMVDPYLPAIEKPAADTRSRKLSRIAKDSNETVSPDDEQNSATLSSSQLEQELELIPLEDLTFVDRVDKDAGANGAVHRAVLRGVVDVAVKTAKGEPDRIEDVIRLLGKEIVQCQRLHHVNIVQFLGACRGKPPVPGTWPGEQLMLVNELMAISLFEQFQLLRSKRKSIGWVCAVKWAYNIACGMEHLHHRNLNHLDLKSANVLLSGAGNSSTGRLLAGASSTAKIADFGNLRRAVAQPTQTQTMTCTRTTFRLGDELQRPEDNGVPTRPTEQQALKLASRFAKGLNDQSDAAAVAEELGLVELPETSPFAQGLARSYLPGEMSSQANDFASSIEDPCALGTPEWMAPELLDGPKMVTPKADVYSFGMVLYELLTMDRPYMGFPGWREIRAGHFGPDLVAIWAMEGYRPGIPASCPPVWSRLMKDCWAANPTERPSFKELARRLKGIKDSGEARTWPVDAMGPQRLEAAKAAAMAAAKAVEPEEATSEENTPASVVAVPATRALAPTEPGQREMKVVAGVARRRDSDQGGGAAGVVVLPAQRQVQ